MKLTPLLIVLANWSVTSKSMLSIFIVVVFKCRVITKKENYMANVKIAVLEYLFSEGMIAKIES